MLVLINAIWFYLIIVKKLMDKYNAFTFEMDLFIRVLMVLPFGWSQFES
jgi:hypothetical protein